MMKSVVVLVLGILISQTHGGFSYRSRSAYGQASSLPSYGMTPRYRTSVSAAGIADSIRQQRRQTRASYPFLYLDKAYSPEDYILGYEVTTGKEITCYDPGYIYDTTGLGLLPFSLPSTDTYVYSCAQIGVTPPPMPPLQAALVAGYYYACPSSLDLYQPLFWKDGTIKTTCKFFFYDLNGRIIQSYQQPFLDPSILIQSYL